MSDQDQKIATIRRKLSFKMPMTFRYSFALGLVTGLVHCTLAKRPSLFFKHVLTITPIGTLSLCYREFHDIAVIYTTKP